MRIELAAFYVLALGPWHATAQEVNPDAIQTEACRTFHEDISRKRDNGQLAEAGAALSQALAAPENVLGESCGWLTVSNMATVFALSGRIAEAEALAKQSLRMMDKWYAPGDPVRFRPLHLLSSMQFQQAKWGKARETFRHLQALHIEQPGDRALVHGLAALWSEVEGRYQDAEREYFSAIAAWKQAGRDENADMATMFIGVGTLYLKQGRYRESAMSLDRALAIVNTARDAVPTDRVKVLAVRAALHTRQGQWREAGEELRSAISIADKDVRLDPPELKAILACYAFVLRKGNRKAEARSVEARAAAIRLPEWSKAMVDVTELRSRK